MYDLYLQWPLQWSHPRTPLEQFVCRPFLRQWHKVPFGTWSLLPQAAQICWIRLLLGAHMLRKKPNKMVYNTALWLNIRSSFLDVSADRCRKFHTDDVTRVSISDWLLLGFDFVITKAFFRSNVFWEEKNRERRKKNFSSLSRFHTILFVNSFNPGFNSALTLTVNYSWMRSPSRYRRDTVSEKQNTHIWKRDKKKQKTRSIRLLQSNVEPTTNLIPSIKFVSCEVSRLCRALQAFKYRSNRNYLLMITPILS